MWDFNPTSLFIIIESIPPVVMFDGCAKFRSIMRNVHHLIMIVQSNSEYQAVQNKMCCQWLNHNPSYYVHPRTNNDYNINKGPHPAQLSNTFRMQLRPNPFKKIYIPLCLRFIWQGQFFKPHMYRPSQQSFWTYIDPNSSQLPFRPEN